MKIALAQLNPTVGAIRSNADLALAAVERAAQLGAQLVVTSELLISGYPPKDLLLREAFVSECDRVVEVLAGQLLHGHHVVFVYDRYHSSFEEPQEGVTNVQVPQPVRKVAAGQQGLRHGDALTAE